MNSSQSILKKRGGRNTFPVILSEDYPDTKTRKKKSQKKKTAGQYH